MQRLNSSRLHIVDVGRQYGHFDLVQESSVLQVIRDLRGDLFREADSRVLILRR
jgi:hypothetical protein